MPHADQLVDRKGQVPTVLPRCRDRHVYGQVQGRDLRLGTVRGCDCFMWGVLGGHGWSLRGPDASLPKPTQGYEAHVVLVEEGQVADDAHPDKQRGGAQEDAADVIARQVLGVTAVSVHSTPPFLGGMWP